MKAIVKKIYPREITTADGRQFKKIVFECAVEVDDHRTVRTYRAEMSPEYVVKYFKEYCGITSAELIGQTVEVTLRQRNYTNKNGEERTITEIRYLNLLDAVGEPIIMPRDDAPANVGF